MRRIIKYILMALTFFAFSYYSLSFGQSGGVFYPMAEDVEVDTTNFDNNLNATHTDVQKCLDRLDDVAGSGGASKLSGLSDVGTVDYTDGHYLRADGTDYDSSAILDGDLPDTITRDSEWDTIGEIEAVTGVDIITSTENNDTADDLSDNSINDLSDVTVSTPSGGQVLKYNAGTSKWENSADDTGTDTLDDLSDNSIDDLNDVAVSSPSDGQLLKYNATSTDWENWTPNYLTAENDPVFSAMDTEVELENQITDVGNIYTNNDGSLTDDDLSNNSINDLSDVVVSSPADTQVLKYNSTSGKWENAADDTGNDSADDLSDNSINDLSDVDTTGWASGKVLKFDGSGNLVVGTDNVDDADADATNELQNIFQNISDGTNTAIADTTTDTFTLEAGTGISITVDATNDKATITNTGDTDASDDLTTSTSFGGDVSGTYDAISVNKIKGKTVDDTNIADGKVLKYNSTSGNLEYQDDNNTTYSADGEGLELSGTQFSLELDGATLSKSASGLKVNSITSSEIADGTITNTDIADDTIAEAKLDIYNAPTGGYYLKYDATNGMMWADVSVETGDITAIGDVTTGDAFTGSQGNKLYFEGATANDYETILQGQDVTSDVTVNLPSASGTLLNKEQIDTEAEFESLLFSVFTPNDGSLTDDDLSNNTTDDLAEGSSNLYWTQARFDNAFTGKSTDDLSEGSSNLYFTNARAISAVEGNANVFTADQTLTNNHGLFGKRNDGTPKQLIFIDTDNNVDIGEAADTLRFFVGSEKARITSEGKVGIGTNSPNASLTIGNNAGDGFDQWSDYQILLYTNPSPENSYGIGIKANTLAFNTDRDFDFDQDGSTVVTINEGKVGIGTTSPSQKLTLSGGNILLDNNYAIMFKDSGGTARTILKYASSNDVELSNSQGDFVFTNSKVGIGTNSPGEKLDVEDGEIQLSGGYGIDWEDNPWGGDGDDAWIRYIQDGSGDDAELQIGIANDSSDNIAFYQGGSERLTIWSGNIGIRTNSPAYILTVVQYSSTDPIADAWTTYSTKDSKIIINEVEEDETDKLLQSFLKVPLHRYKKKLKKPEYNYPNILQYSKNLSYAYQKYLKKVKEYEKKQNLQKFKNVYFGMVAEEAPEMCKVYDKDGKLGGINNTAYIGWLHANLKALVWKVEKLEERVNKLEKELRRVRRK